MCSTHLWAPCSSVWDTRIMQTTGESATLKIIPLKRVNKDNQKPKQLYQSALPKHAGQQQNTHFLLHTWHVLRWRIFTALYKAQYVKKKKSHLDHQGIFSDPAALNWKSVTEEWLKYIQILKYKLTVINGTWIKEGTKRETGKHLSDYSCGYDLSGSKDAAKAAHGSKFIASQLLLQGPPASSLSFSLINENIMKKMGNINIKIEIGKLENRKTILNFEMLYLYSQIRNQRDGFIKQFIYSKSIMSGYYKQIHPNKTNNLNKMHQKM